VKSRNSGPTQVPHPAKPKRDPYDPEYGYSDYERDHVSDDVRYKRSPLTVFVGIAVDLIPGLRAVEVLDRIDWEWLANVDEMLRPH
jgi:hypothetical protein